MTPTHSRIPLDVWAAILGALIILISWMAEPAKIFAAAFIATWAYILFSTFKAE